MKKRILSLIIAALMLLSAVGMTSCNKSGKYTVGICQLAPHAALDAATNGFKQALIDELGEENVTFDYQNAAGEANTCATIVNNFVSKKVDLIMANATSALQAAANMTTEIPILGTSITEYGVALDIKNFNGTVGGNISGTSDLAPLDQQAQMFVDLLPEAKKIGILYCSAEPNSVYQVQVIKSELEKRGLTCELCSFSDSNDVSTVVAAACTRVDAFYIPTDNTAASCAETIYNAMIEKKAIITGEEGPCRSCGIATLTISYYDLGYATGKMAAKILRGEANISEMPVAYAETFTKKYNPDICRELGITTITSDYVAIEN